MKTSSSQDYRIQQPIKAIPRVATGHTLPNDGSNDGDDTPKVPYRNSEGTEYSPPDWFLQQSAPIRLLHQQMRAVTAAMHSHAMPRR